MARIRSIKPEFWTDGDVMDLSAYARLLFIGSWNFAICDLGHVADDPRRLKMQVLPCDDVDGVALVEEIIAAGRMTRIRVGDRSFLHIKRFTDHQKLEKRWSPRCPACQGLAALEANSPDLDSPPATSPNLSETPGTSAQEGTGGDRTGEEVAPDGATSRGSTSLALVGDPDDPPRLDVQRLCNRLADAIEANGSKRPTIGKGWSDAARLLLDRDHRTEEQVAAAIDWCQADEFWRVNVLSMPKLREKYDQLRLAAQRERAPTGAKNDIDWDAAMERARARDAANGEP